MDLRTLCKIQHGETKKKGKYERKIKTYGQQDESISLISLIGILQEIIEKRVKVIFKEVIPKNCLESMKVSNSGILTNYQKEEQKAKSTKEISDISDHQRHKYSNL